jgi:hypothetical protein
VLKDFTVEQGPRLIPPEVVKRFTPITALEFQATNKVAAVDRGLLESAVVKHANVAFSPAVAIEQPGLLLRNRLKSPAWAAAILADGVGAAAPAPEPPAPQPAPQPSTTSDITVLAFICKRLPKTPDPLPDIQW